MAEKSQIYGGQRLEQAHAAGTVPQTVVGLQRDAAVVIVYPNKVTVVTFKMHGHTGVFDIFLYKGAGSCVGLQITPEQSLPDRHLVGGKTGQRQIKRLL